ncbi:MAG: GntR family transcriptional regulator [Lentisphaeria bacterium]|nr:GntR family transcriptional regulator [Lentisphaeria bacterium]
MNSKYQRLAEQIELAILRGEYPVDSFLPGERTLGERYKLSRVTVRSALDLLTVKRLITPIAARGYKVLCRAEASSTNRSHLIGAIFPGYKKFDTAVPHYLVGQLTEGVQNSDYSLLIDESADLPATERECIQKMIRRNVEALAIMPAFSGGALKASINNTGNYSLFKELYDNGLPIVLMDRHLNGTGLPGVYNDDVAGGALQAEYMLKRGFSQIIYFMAHDNHVDYLRYTGYCNAMRQAGLAPLSITPSDFCNTSAWNVPCERHEKELQVIFPLINQDTALVCSCFLAPALDKAFPNHRYGKHRVEWICYDYTADHLGTNIMPYPCALRPIDKIGRLATEKLLKLLAGDKSAATEEFIPPVIDTTAHETRLW